MECPVPIRKLPVHADEDPDSDSEDEDSTDEDSTDDRLRFDWEREEDRRK